MKTAGHVLYKCLMVWCRFRNYK